MFEKICRILSEFTQVEADSMTPESDLLNDLAINSLEIMEAVVRFEEQFDIEILDRQIASFHTVGDIVDYISSLDVAGAENEMENEGKRFFAKESDLYVAENRRESAEN